MRNGGEPTPINKVVTENLIPQRTRGSPVGGVGRTRERPGHDEQRNVAGTPNGLCTTVLSLPNIMIDDSELNSSWIASSAGFVISRNRWGIWSAKLLRIRKRSKSKSITPLERIPRPDHGYSRRI